MPEDIHLVLGKPLAPSHCSSVAATFVELRSAAGRGHPPLEEGWWRVHRLQTPL